MKAVILKNEIRLIPENPSEEVYLEKMITQSCIIFYREEDGDSFYMKSKQPICEKTLIK